MKIKRFLSRIGKNYLLAVACLIVASMVSSAAMAESAGSVDGGLAMLAKQIVKKSVAADRKTIAVLPFPNSDGSCSVLSTYLVDELILGLFSVPDSPVTIIERSQIEALISEMAIGEGGLLNPETTQKLGSITGVQALTVGTITVIGDSVRVNARLVNTESGRTISAAAVTLPRTNAVTQLLKQPLSRNVACGSNAGKSARVASTGSAAFAGSSFSAVPVVAPGSSATYNAGSVTIQITNIIASDEGHYKVIGLVTNTAEKPISVMWLGPMVMMDPLGNAVSALSSTGILPCLDHYGKWVKVSKQCVNKGSDYTVLTPGLPRNFAMTFGDSKKPVKMHIQAALTGRIWVKGEKEKTVPFNFPGLILPESQVEK